MRSMLRAVGSFISTIMASKSLHLRENKGSTHAEIILRRDHNALNLTRKILMNFDQENIPLTPSSWFSDKVAYEGRARAEFRDPPGTVEGHGHVRFDTYGKPSVELDVERFESAEPLPFGLLQLLSGRKAVTGKGVIMISGDGGERNPCTKVSVTTPHGEFF